MKKVKNYKGFVIAVAKWDATEFAVYTADEWSYGEGRRYAEMDCQSLKEAMDFIDSY